MDKVIKIKCKGTAEIPLDKLQDFQGNLKKLKNEDYEKLKASIIKYGFRIPIFVWQNNICDGHQRIFTLKKMIAEGYKLNGNIPVVKIQAKDKTEAKKILLLINNRYARVEPQGLYDFLKDAEIKFDDIKMEIDFPEFEIDDFANKFFPNESVGDDEIPEVKESIVKLGDLIELGRHRLLCGDCTIKENVDKLMAGKKADILTDPPYNIGFNYNKYKDTKNDKEYADFIKKWFSIVFNNSIKIIITPGPKNEMLYSQPIDKGYWIKKNATAQSKVFKIKKIEPILFYGIFKNKRLNDIFDFASGFTNELKNAQAVAGVLENQAPAKSMNLWVELINMLGNDILDIFMGNGTTLIACEKTGRICYGMEIDPHYCDVIVERYKKWCADNGRQAVVEINKNNLP